MKTVTNSNQPNLPPLSEYNWQNVEDDILPISNVKYEKDIEEYFKTKSLMTMIPCVNDLFMYGFNMSFQVPLMSCHITTLTTRISDMFMYGFNMSFQVPLMSCHITTSTTRISNTFMNGFKVSVL